VYVTFFQERTGFTTLFEKEQYPEECSGRSDFMVGLCGNEIKWTKNGLDRLLFTPISVLRRAFCRKKRKERRKVKRK
jgi:hypothetical protein